MHRRPLLFAAFAGVVALLVLTAPTVRAADDVPASLSWFDDAARSYLVYDPAHSSDAAARPLLVYLHGCNQGAEDAFVGQRLRAIADTRNVIIALPEQPRSANGARCWNWFLPEHQERDTGEAAIIADITNRTVARANVDPTRVYVAGVSAGGVMTANMGALFPDVYRAIGVIAGCPFRTGSDVSGQLAFAAMGSRARAVPTFVANGTIDVAVPYPQARNVVSEWLGVADLADDGLMNLSVPRQAASTSTTVGAAPSPLSGDACLPDGRPTAVPCAGGVIGFQESYPSTVERWNDAAGHPIVELLTIHGANHAVTGGDTTASFTDPLGPNTVTAALDFFAEL